jgi:protein gp37
VKNTLIEWCHHTVNFWWGCTFGRLRDGSMRQECVHCYAKRLAARLGKGRATWGEAGRRWLRVSAAARELFALDESARRRGVRERVFVNSMSDTFEDRRDLDEPRRALAAACSVVTNLDIVLLTKRPEAVLRLVPMRWIEDWPAHVWLGATAGTQRAADEAVPELLRIPARVRFLSCEPLLELVTLRTADVLAGFPAHITADGRAIGAPLSIHWVICGGESGPGARPMHPYWARALRNQCQAMGVPFFFKQWGEWTPINEPWNEDSPAPRAKNERWLNVAGGCGFHGEAVWRMRRVGKKAAGRDLDGWEFNHVPAGSS